MFWCVKENGVFLIETMRPVFHPAYQIIREKLKEIAPIRQVSLSYGVISFMDIAAPKDICCRIGKNMKNIEMTVSEQDIQYEIQEFTSIVRVAEYPDTYQKYSVDTLHLIDEVKGQLGIIFHADACQE